MKLRVNGDFKEFQTLSSVTDLLNQLEIQQKGIAIEVNCSVISREAWSSVHLKEGDQVEIVQFVGGGI